MISQVRTFLDAMLIANPVFVSLAGALLVCTGPEGAKKSFRTAVRYGFVFTAVALAGGSLESILPAEAAPLVFAVCSFLGLAVLNAWAPEKESWMGMPRQVLYLAPLFGFQLLVSGLPPGQLVAAASGNGIGLAGAYIIISAIREHSRIGEAPVAFKTTPVILFSMAVFSLLMGAFLFY